VPNPGTVRPVSTFDAPSFIAGLPKAELHLHLQGAASIETVLGLSRRYPEAGLPQDEATMAEFYQFTDFANFIDVYVAVSRLVQTDTDVYDLAMGLARDLADVNVRYAESTVTVDSHLRVGIAPDALADALNRGRRDAWAETGVELAWVYDIDGEFGVPSGLRTLEWARDFLPDGSVGFGIGGPEAGVDRADYGRLFDQARELGLHSVPHAGETVGPEQVWSAIDALGAERVGHGIAAAADPHLMDELARRRIALEICPTSNICTRAVSGLPDHPFPMLRDAGILVTVNTDDPGMFATDINNEYLVAHEVFGLDRADLAELARDSVRASFAAGETKDRILSEIDAYVSSAD
jgi:aminodeoxyfutalosine deaminase